MRFRSTFSVAAPLAALSLAALSACGPKAAADTGNAGRTDQITETKLVEEDLLLQEIDLDGNGTTDIFNYYRERAAAPRLLVLKKVDLDFDGRIDVTTTFDTDGSLKTEEMDGDFDGRVDWVDHYQNGTRVMAEADSNYDGDIDIYFYYRVDEDGTPRIERKERDTNGDGRIDTWERFDGEGNVIKTGRDTDGDGKMDVRDD